MGLLPRDALRARVLRALREAPIAALVGPRQCGKSTLARQVLGNRGGEWFDLESPADARRLSEPMSSLSPLRGLVVIDEVQRAPDVLPVLRVLADRRPVRTRFLLLGSAAPELMKGAAETLAGRIAFVDMSGFDLTEVGGEGQRKLWLRGGFPRSFLAGSEASSFRWREDFVRTFLERDLRTLGVTAPPESLRKLWTMIAHYHGQIWNGSEVARSLGESHTTVRRHLDGLIGSLVVRRLKPWFENLSKREVKSPKMYLRDTGILHTLLGLTDFRALEGSPRLGASWEGLVVDEVIRAAGERSTYYWATQSGAELDILVHSGSKRWGFEAKYGDAPGPTRSMHAAVADLRLEQLFVVRPSKEPPYALAPRVQSVSLSDLASVMKKARIVGRR